MTQGEDFAYLAGLFDGEGCVSLVRVKDERAYREFWSNFESDTYTPVLKVVLASTTRSIVYYLKELFGGSISCRSSNGTNRKPLYSWCIVSSAAIDFLNSILPYLRIKKEQALIGIAWQDTVKDRGPCSYSIEEKERRELLYRQLKELNHRGIR